MLKQLFFIGSIFFSATVLAQSPYTKGMQVKEKAAPLMLNYTASTSSLEKLSADITILDFFGTWCVPCIKALPHLETLQKEFGNKISIVLVSNEKKEKLQSFLQKNSTLSFPVWVDEDNSMTAAFAPPSYPYTAVLDKNNTIIALTDAASINTENIKAWLAGENTVMSNDIKPNSATTSTAIMTNNEPSNNKLVALSQEFMYAAKTGDNTAAFVDSMKSLDLGRLKNELQTDTEKKAFWINAYNAYTQVLLKNDPKAYEHRKQFFTGEQINVAGEMLSLDDIEHGFLRRSKVKWSLGYFGKLFPCKTEKALRVKKLDYRIHFALNCGAKSCPPIAFYNPEQIDRQLDLATAAYLKAAADYDSSNNKLGLPAILGWFRRDFGGKKGMLKICRSLNIIPAHAKPEIYFKDYNWELGLDNYVKE